MTLAEILPQLEAMSEDSFGSYLVSTHMYPPGFDAEFRRLALTKLGVVDHKNADKLYWLAWERGHSSGYYKVWQNLMDLAELLK